ncbi:MAG: hypothetical protein JRJ01_02325 [Deltaproteobacteria bacterium]|nr:hypothetical protein [Deltaproteobacteria bacterium]
MSIPFERQVKAWRKANKKMSWGIPEDSFREIMKPLPLTEKDRAEGFVEVGLFYGFGDDGTGHSDAVLSGKLAWSYAAKKWWKKTWQCNYIDFNRTDSIRLRTGAPPRPKGFYFAKVRLGNIFQSLTVSRARKAFNKDTGLGPEGIQMVVITHPFLQDLMNTREMPFMALADYDVAPYGFNDFFDAAQLFCSNGVLGLGIGNVDNNYPLFAIPTIRLEIAPEDPST